MALRAAAAGLTAQAARRRRQVRSNLIEETREGLAVQPPAVAAAAIGGRPTERISLAEPERLRARVQFRYQQGTREPRGPSREPLAASTT